MNRAEVENSACESVTGSSPSERLVKTIRRATRKQYSAKEKIGIDLDGLRGESSIAELCCREGIAEAPAGDDWLHEIKYDGYRIHARLEHGRSSF